VHQIVDSYLQAGGRSDVLPPLSLSVGKTSSSVMIAPKILILAPHPDDECLMSGFALRAREEWNAEVHVLSFSFGSDLSRRSARIQELKDALQVLDFKLIDPRTAGATEKLTTAEYESVMASVQPDVILSPHLQDGHPAHMESASLVQNWFAQQSATEAILPVWLQTEYWQQNPGANAFVPLNPVHVIRIGEALQKHQGEVSRNPYHLRLPAWCMDQSRRAQELIGGFGATAHSSGSVAPVGQFMFGQLLQRV
jgi:LmbE family N-acetylglucosaminyl deacetylase